MKTFLDACSAFAKAFLVVAVAAAAGLLSLPDYGGVGSRALAAGCAAIAAGLAALQTFVPAISVRRYIDEPWGSAIDSAIHAGLAIFLTMTAGWFNSPDFSAWHAFATSLVVAVAAAVLRALQGGLFGPHPQEVPTPNPRRTATPADPPRLLLPIA